MVAELRELESDHAERIWRVHGLSYQQYLARKTGIPQSNICKWQAPHEERKLIAAAADEVKKGLFKAGVERRWFGRAEMILQRRKRRLRPGFGSTRGRSGWKRIRMTRVQGHSRRRTGGAGSSLSDTSSRKVGGPT